MLPAKRSPPTCVLSQVASGNAAPSARRDRTPALGAARVSPAVRADDEERTDVGSSRNEPRSRGIEGRRVVDPVEDRGAAPRVARVDADAADPAVVGRGDAARSADQQHPGAGPGFEGAEVPSDAVGEPGVEEPVASPRSRMLDQQPVADRGRRAGERLLGRQAPQRAAIVDRGHGRLSDRRGS